MSNESSNCPNRGMPWRTHPTTCHTTTGPRWKSRDEAQAILDRAEAERIERHEVEGEWLEQIEKLGGKLTYHREGSACFSCTLTRFLAVLASREPSHG